MVRISDTDVKTHFALSGNVCSYTGCEETLTDPSWRRVKADIAHIRGERETSARYDPTMTDQERSAFDNLILLCPNHHRRIDGLEPQAHTVEMLQEMKQRHESRTEQWASEEQLVAFAALAIAAMPDEDPPSPGQMRLRDDLKLGVSTSLTVEPGLVIRRRGSNLDIVNETDADAFGVTVTAVIGSNVVDLATIPPPRISAHQSWSAGVLQRAEGSTVPVQLRLHWKDAGGHLFEKDTVV